MLKLIPCLSLEDIRKLRAGLDAANVKCYLVNSDLGFVNYVAAGWVAVAWSDVSPVRYLFVSKEK